MSYTPIEKVPFQWKIKEVFTLYLFCMATLAWFLILPLDYYDPFVVRLFSALGLIAIWRYGWWMTHFVRALIYEYRVFPKMRHDANALLDTGWRPKSLAFMMTTFKEHPITTQKVLISIMKESERLGVPTTLFVGTGDPYDEGVITEQVDRYRHAMTIDFKVIFIRQTAPGKRVAIGLTLRAMSREGVQGDTPVVFLDGDSILDHGVLHACVPFFELNPKMHALTTFEKPLIFGGSDFVKHWYDLRFAQRNLAMQSHALSKRVLTLTGRLSIIRASQIIDEEFISIVENDSLFNWHWGSFRFLSGDDKSTWFTLLKRGSEMMYVPDACVHTVERIPDEWFDRVSQNLLRWSGNMLRNGSRAIAIGPRTVGPFIWWCIVDQRIAMWTCLAGPIAVIFGAILWSPLLLLTLPPWAMFTRTLLSSFLYYHHRQIDPWFPFVLYFNQIASSVLKIFILFRLPMQRWANRGDQRAFNKIDWPMKFKSMMASYLTIIWVSLFVIGVLLYTGVIRAPLTDFFLKIFDYVI